MNENEKKINKYNNKKKKFLLVILLYYRQIFGKLTFPNLYKVNTPTANCKQYTLRQQ